MHKTLVILSKTEAHLLSVAIRNHEYSVEDIDAAKKCDTDDSHFVTLIANLSAPANISAEVLNDFADELEEM